MPYSRLFGEPHRPCQSTGKIAVKAAPCKILGALAAIGLIGLVTACGSKPPPPPPPTVVSLNFAATGDVNPDLSGRPSPVIIRYYQLAATGAFDSADYFQLRDKEAALLGPALLDRQDLALTPGAKQDVQLQPKPEAKFIGLVASYRDIDNAGWRAEVAIPPNKTTTVKVQVDKLKLSISSESK
jgi:type VI secretion system protein VasD